MLNEIPLELPTLVIFVFNLPTEVGYFLSLVFYGVTAGFDELTDVKFTVANFASLSTGHSSSVYLSCRRQLLRVQLARGSFTFTLDKTFLSLMIERARKGSKFDKTVFAHRATTELAVCNRFDRLEGVVA